MRRGNEEPVKKRSIMLPDSFVAEMAVVREQIGAQSDSEVIRRAFKLYRRLLGDDKEVRVKDRATGEEVRLEVL